MYRKYYLVEVVILLLLSHGGWNGPSVTLLSCTSESSKLIRNVVHKQFLPIVSRYGVSLPLECPLHPHRDIFSWLQTDIEGVATYRCPVCGQKFHCETKFVTHLDASHARGLGLAEETVCLDDYCDVFRCTVLRQKRELAKRNEQNVEQAHPINDLRPINLENEEYRAEKKEECNPKAMAELQNKCRSVIRHCTLGMVANLSSKDFQDLEDELDQAICSYLTCEKYWDDFDVKLHFIPTALCIIILLLVFIGFCLCYYGIWLLMENSATNAEDLCCNCRKPRPVSRQKREKYYTLKNAEAMQQIKESRDMLSIPTERKMVDKSNYVDRTERQNAVPPNTLPIKSVFGGGERM